MNNIGHKKDNGVKQQILKLGVCDAVLSFNKGAVAKVNVLERLSIQPGLFMVKGFRETLHRVIKTDKEIQEEENTKKKAGTKK